MIINPLHSGSLWRFVFTLHCLKCRWPVLPRSHQTSASVRAEWRAKPPLHIFQDRNLRGLNTVRQSGVKELLTAPCMRSRILCVAGRMSPPGQPSRFNRFCLESLLSSLRRIDFHPPELPHQFKTKGQKWSFLLHTSFVAPVLPAVKALLHIYSLLVYTPAWAGKVLWWSQRICSPSVYFNILLLLLLFHSGIKRGKTAEGEDAAKCGNLRFDTISEDVPEQNPHTLRRCYDIYFRMSNMHENISVPCSWERRQHVMLTSPFSYSLSWRNIRRCRGSKIATPPSQNWVSTVTVFRANRVTQLLL